MGRPAHSWTTILVYLASIVERADEHVLPAVYFFVGRSLGATPSQLGAITFSRAIVQAISSPVSGVIGDKFDRTKVIAAGCLLWGIMTSAIAMADSVNEAMVYAGLNGIGLALVVPCCQSIVAYSYPSEKRGRAFGYMQATGFIGVLAGGLFATNVGHTTPFGMDGWRFALHCVAMLSIITGVLVYLFAKDPRTHRNPGSKSGTYEAFSLLDGAEIPLKDDAPHARRVHSYLRESSDSFGSFSGEISSSNSIGNTCAEIKHVLSVRSFQVIVLQGVVGSLPWTAMVFMTLWLQLLGFSDFAASTLMSCFHCGSAIGGALGGCIGDRLSKLIPDHGRIYTAQFSVAIGIPFTFILLQMLPSANVAGAPLVYGLVMFLMSSLTSWCSTGCNSPIFADIVPENLYSKIYAFDRSFEGAVAATAAPMVGIISEKFFGFKGDAASGRGKDAENAASLGNSLFVCLVVPWLLCFLFYCGLHAYYADDRRRARRSIENVL